jgi:DNA-binding Lrp family transcriptional regulator
MSTVQRRTRKLFEKGIVRSRIELDYQKLGLRKGLLHVYLKEGHINSIAEKVSHIKGIQSATIHIGNSDIVGVFVFKDAAQLLEIMNYAKKIEGVDRVVWSEEVFTLPSNGDSYALESIAKGNH